MNRDGGGEALTGTGHCWTRHLPAVVREKLEGRREFLNLVSNTGWQYADSILRMGIALLIGVWLARYLGPDQYGLLSYALAFVSLFSAFGTLGLDDLIVRDVVRDPASSGSILGSAFFLRLLGGGFSLAAAIGAIFLLRPADGESQLLVGIVAVGALFQAFGVIEFWFHSQVQARFLVLAKGAAFLVCSLAKVALILAGGKIAAFAVVALFETVLGAAGLVAAYRAAGNRLLSWRVEREKVGGLVRDGWPLMLSGLVIMVYLRIDQVMLGEMAGNQEVGIYSVAVRMAEVWYFIPSALYWSLLPGIVEAKSVSEELLSQRLQKFYNVMALSAYLVAIPVTLVANWLVPALFGEAYARGGFMLGVLIWSNLFTALEMARSAFLTTMNWTRVYLATVSLGCLFNIALNFVLIPRYGGVGAAVASVCAYWLAAHGSCFLFRELRKTGVMLTRALLYPKIW